MNQIEYISKTPANVLMSNGVHLFTIYTKTNIHLPLRKILYPITNFV